MVHGSPCWWPNRAEGMIHANIRRHKYSLLMHRIKIKSPAIFFFFFFLMNKTFLWVDLSFFNLSYSGGITTTKKPTGYWWYYHSRCRPPRCNAGCHGAWRPHHERQVQLLMHCIKIKSPAKFLLNEQNVFVGGNISFLCVLSCSSEEA